MNRPIITILFLSFLIGISASELIFAATIKKDETGRIMIVGGDTGAPGQASVSKPGEDRLWKDVVQSDSQSRKNYVAIVNEGIKLAEQGQYTQAVSKYISAIAIEPSLSYAYLNLANAYWHLHRNEESIVMSKKALEIDPVDARIYENLGNAYYSSGKYKEAKESYRKAKELFEKNSDLDGIFRMNGCLARF